MLSWLTVISAWAARQAVFGSHRFSDKVIVFINSIANFPTEVKGVFGLVNHWFPPVGVENIYKSETENKEIIRKVSGYLLIPYVSSNGESEVKLVGIKKTAIQSYI